MMGKNSWSYYVSIGVVAIILAIVPLVLRDTSFYMRVATMMLAFMIYTVAFNIIFGHTRQLFLCMGALAGTSAYLSVILIRELGIPTWGAIFLGVFVAGLIGGIFSYVAARRGLAVIFVAVITIAFSLVFYNLILGLVEYTAGETGIVTRTIGFTAMRNPVYAYYIFLVILVSSLLMYYFMMRSRIGTAFRALSDDEFTAELVGINVTRYKVLAGVVGSSLIGLVGAFYAFFNGFIGPYVYYMLHVDIPIFLMLLFGGMGTLLGPILGGAIFSIVIVLVRPLGALNLFVYGGLIVVFFAFFREGLVVTIQRLVRRLISRPSSSASAMPDQPAPDSKSKTPI